MRKLPEFLNCFAAGGQDSSCLSPMTATHAASCGCSSEHATVEDDGLLASGAIREADRKAVIHSYPRNKGLGACTSSQTDCAPVINRSSCEFGGREIAESDRERRACVSLQYAGSHERQNQIVIPAGHNESRWPRAAFGRLKAVRQEFNSHCIGDRVGDSCNAPTVEIAFDELCLTACGRCKRDHRGDTDRDSPDHVILPLFATPAYRLRACLVPLAPERKIHAQTS